VSDFAKEMKFSPQDVDAITLAVDEAFTNIIRHATSSSQESVKLEVHSDQRKMTISLFDHGKSFTPEPAVQPDLQAMIKEKKKGGMGVYLIHQLMDEVKYFRKGPENEVRMVKHRTTS
jgi:serine/threonine-protein kinase RsbW